MYSSNFLQISALESFPDFFPRCSVKLLYQSVNVDTVETVGTVETPPCPTCQKTNKPNQNPPLCWSFTVFIF